MIYNIHINVSNFSSLSFYWNDLPFLNSSAISIFNGIPLSAGGHGLGFVNPGVGPRKRPVSSYNIISLQIIFQRQVVPTDNILPGHFPTIMWFFFFFFSNEIKLQSLKTKQLKVKSIHNNAFSILSWAPTSYSIIWF